MNNKIIKQIMVALFLVMVIMQPQNAKGADVFAVGNWGNILHYAGEASTAMSTPLSTNTPDPATVVTLTSLTATLSNREILIEWETATEEDTLGFYIYRSEAENGSYTTQVNSGMVTSTGSVVSGGQYFFSDTSILNGRTYYYKLTSIDAHGNTTWYDDFIASATANWPCQENADCANGLFCDGATNQCISISSSTSTIAPVSTTTSTITPVSTTTTTTNANSTTSTTSGGGGGTSTTSTVSVTTSIITTSTTSPVTTSTTTISPTSTTTSTQLSTTTTKPTTTTTIQSGPCAAEAIYGENSEETELLRKYRDNVLSKTPEGQEIIKTYYKFSPTVIMLLEQRPLLKNRAKIFIDGMLQGIRNKVEESNKEP